MFGINLKLILIVSALAICAGLFGYHTLKVNSLQAKILVRDNQIVILQAKNDALESTNQSLEAKVALKVEEALNVRIELAEFRAIDKVTQKTVSEMEKKLNDHKYTGRLKDIRNSKKASLLLRFANKNVKCFSENIEEQGTCVMGSFREVKDDE